MLSREHEVRWIVLLRLCHTVPDAVFAEDARIFAQDIALDAVVAVAMSIADAPIGSLLVFGDEECHEAVIFLNWRSKKSINHLAFGSLALL